MDTDKVSTDLEADETGVLHIITPEGAEVDIGAVIAELTVGGVATAAAAPKEEPKKEAPKEVAAPAKTASAAVLAEVKSLKPDLSVLPSAPKKEQVTEESDGRTTRKKMSMLRRKIATQLVNVQQTAAILTTFNEADMTAIMDLRKQHKEAFKERHGVGLGFMSFFVKACCSALARFERVNAYIDGNEVEYHDYMDVSVAVGTSVS